MANSQKYLAKKGELPYGYIAAQTIVGSLRAASGNVENKDELLVAMGNLKFDTIL